MIVTFSLFFRKVLILTISISHMNKTIGDIDTPTQNFSLDRSTSVYDDSYDKVPKTLMINTFNMVKQWIYTNTTHVDTDESLTLKKWSKKEVTEKNGNFGKNKKITFTLYPQNDHNGSDPNLSLLVGWGRKSHRPWGPYVVVWVEKNTVNLIWVPIVKIRFRDVLHWKRMRLK